MRPHMKKADRPQQHDDGDGRNQSRQQTIAERVVILCPDHGAIPALFLSWSISNHAEFPWYRHSSPPLAIRPSLRGMTGKRYPPFRDAEQTLWRAPCRSISRNGVGGIIVHPGTPVQTEPSNLSIQEHEEDGLESERRDLAPRSRTRLAHRSYDERHSRPSLVCSEHRRL